jgi:hypothetical protein
MPEYEAHEDDLMAHPYPRAVPTTTLAPLLAGQPDRGNAPIAPALRPFRLDLPHRRTQSDHRDRQVAAATELRIAYH